MKIDTSTTAGKIAVMQAFEDGKKIYCKFKEGVHDFSPMALDKTPSWNWDDYDYKVAPMTAEEAAKHQDRIFKNDAERSEYQLGFVIGAKWQKEQESYFK